jgi:hypothetical protein
MMIWISQATGMPVPEPPPLAYTTPKQMVIMTYGCDQSPVLQGNEQLCKSLDGGAPNASPPEILAFYQDKTGIVYLKKGWTGDTLREKSILLHELVHHMQYKSGVDPKICSAKLEDQAYKLQDRWLRERGSTLEKEIKINEFFLLMITQCQVFPLYCYSGPAPVPAP